MNEDADKAGAARQLTFDLEPRAALGLEDFLVSESNASAVKLVDSWPNWPHLIVLISGPKGSGKSHLANVWREMSGAELAPIEALNLAEISQMGTTAGVVVEDIDRRPYDETALFHLINLSKEKQFNLLFTARGRPGEWQISLPDLRSRLRSMSVVDIGLPDDMLLKTVMVKLFNDRQLLIPPHVIDFVARRMERSLEWVGRFVEAVDQAALASRRKVTRQLAAEIINRLEQ